MISEHQRKQIEPQAKELSRRVPWIRDGVTKLRKAVDDPQISGMELARIAKETITTVSELVNRLRDIERYANYAANHERRAQEAKDGHKE